MTPVQAPPELSKPLTLARTVALTAIAVIVLAASAVSFAESYHGLYLWATRHGLHGVWGTGFPLQVDVFIAVGELALFVALADRWDVRSRIAAWSVTLLGLIVSVAANTGHVSGSWTTHATAAIPPLSATLALAIRPLASGARTWWGNVLRYTAVSVLLLLGWVASLAFYLLLTSFLLLWIPWVIYTVNRRHHIHAARRVVAGARLTRGQS